MAYIKEIVLLNPKTIHGSPMNESNKSRRVLIVQFGMRNEKYFSKHEEYLSFKTLDEINLI